MYQLVYGNKKFNLSNLFFLFFVKVMIGGDVVSYIWCIMNKHILIKTPLKLILLG